MIAHDRQKYFGFWLLLSACVPAVVAPISAPNEGPLPIVIDAYAAPGGDGSAGAPLKTLPPRVVAGSHYLVRSGLYRGPFTLGAGARIEGRGEVVLYLEGIEGTVVTAEGESTLTSVSLQGGATGLRTAGVATLERVHFSGHHTAALEATAGASVTAVDCVLKGLTSEAKGVVLTEAQLSLQRAAFSGAFGRSVEARGSTVEIRDTRWDGPRVAVHAISSAVEVHHSSARGGAGPAFFAAKGSMRLVDVTVDGHEYAVQTAEDTELTVDGLVSRKPLLTAFGLVRTQAHLTHVTVEGSGNMGGLQSIESTLELTHSTFTDSRSTGVVVRLGTARLEDVHIRGVRSETEHDGSHSLGDGVHLRGGTSTLSHLTVTDAEGSAVFVTAVAKATVSHLISERAGEGALVVERGSSVEADDVQSTDTLSPAIAVIDGAALTIDHLVVRGSQVPVWAECNEHVTVTIGVMQPPAATQSLGPCVTRR